MEPAPDGSPGFRLRPSPGGGCVGTADDTAAEGAEAVREPCTGGADRRYVILPDRAGPARAGHEARASTRVAVLSATKPMARPNCAEKSRAWTCTPIAHRK